jgi:hypothetical protein
MIHTTGTLQFTPQTLQLAEAHSINEERATSVSVVYNVE